MFSNSKLMLNN